jgi:flagellin FlaB
MNKISKPRRVRMGEEAEMGVGTLLIFIAMILVAAVAAGVLVQTAYVLQQQAESTGDQALMEVATGFRILAAYGMTDLTVPEVTDLYIKITLAAGSPVINLEHVIIEITNGDTDVSLAYNVTGSDVGYFGATQIRDTYPTNDWTTGEPGMTQGDIALIHVNLSANSLSLASQQQADLLIIPKHGIPTYLSVVAPSVLSNTYENLT